MPFTFGSPETRVNTTTAETQNFSAVADIPGFGYVVVWQSPGYNPQFPAESGIFGQVFDYEGRPRGTEFLVSAVDGLGFKSDPAVIGGANGNFTVSWTSFDNFSTGIYQRTFNIVGISEKATLVNTTTQGSQEDQQMTRLADGGHVVTWTSSDSDPAFSGIFARRYDANGVAVGNDFKVNTSPTSFGSGPATAGLAGNGYVVAWSGLGVDGTEIYLQRFAADGSKAGGEVLVNTTTTGGQRHASVAALNDGGYVVAWTSSRPDFTNEVRGQRYDANGVALGGEFVITDNLANAARPDIAALADGGFAVAFESGFKTMLRTYDAQGVPLGTEWPIADGTQNLQSRPATALLGDGSFVVSWHDGDVYTERFRVGDFLTEGVDRAMGTQDSDYMEGFGGDDVLRGGDGDDLLEGGLGADRLIGGDGIDEGTYASATTSVTLNLQTGGHTGEAAGDTFEGIEQFSLTRFGDRFTGGSADDRVHGLAGDDLLIGGTGADRLDGGDDDDVIEGGGGADILIGGAGEDEASYIRDNQGLAIDLGTGLHTGAAAGDGYHSIERFTLTRFADIFTGSSDAERVSGGIGNDMLNGAGGNDQLDGGAGNDRLDGGTGADVMTGGDGDDFYFIDDAGDVVVETAGGGFDQAYVSASHILSAGASVEVLGFTNASATAALNLIGNALGQQIFGNAGANMLTGGGGQDALYGGLGDDAYFVDGDDFLVEAAGGGFDQAYSSTGITLTQGAAIEVLSVNDYASTNALTIIGNELAQQIFGNAGANTLVSGGGADALYGNGGDDIYLIEGDDFLVEAANGGFDQAYSSTNIVLTAGAAIEILGAANAASTAALNLTGNALGQQIFGNAGANVLNGGGGVDMLYGLGGADMFAFTAAPGAGNFVFLADFSAADDAILIDNAVFAGLAAGALNSNAFVNGTAAQDANDRIIYNQASGALLYDADGSGVGAAVQFASLNAGAALTASDFMVI